MVKATVLLAATILPLYAASSVSWTPQFLPTSPSARYDSAMAYDSTRHQLVLFGGGNFNGLQNDTWLWDGVSWTLVNPATSPPARAGHSLAYDSVRQQIVLFGGYVGVSNLKNDTWVWDGSNWTQKTPATSPTVRSGHEMVFDVARSQVVLFGGESALTDIGDTWTWDGTNWTQKSPVTSPTARQKFGFVYDSVSNRSVLFGGTRSQNTGTNDTWVWNGTNWVQQMPGASPSARGNPGMAFDSARNLFVLFGGVDLTNASTPLGDTWYYQNSEWVQITLPTSPSARIGPAMAYDPLHSQTVLFGGTPLNNATWLLGPLTVLPYSLPDATIGADYSFQYSADGGTPSYSFSVSGLPPGLSVNSSNIIAGKCTGQSATGVTISVTDSASPANTASSGSLPLHCNPAPLITNPTPQQGIFNTAYSLQFLTNAIYDPPGAAPYKWSLSNCALPANFILSPTGLLTGNVVQFDPSVISTSYLCSVTFTDRWNATTTKAFTFNFYQLLTVTNIYLPSGTAGTAYSANIMASGGSPPATYSFSATGLPAGLTLGGSTGALSGTPTQTGSFNPTFTVTNQSNQTAQAILLLTINPAAAIQITTPSTLPNGRPSQAYTAQIAWSGGVSPFTVTGTGLPSWLSVSSSGALSGTPPTTGTFSLTLTVTDSQTPTHNSTSKNFTIAVSAPAITTTSPLSATTIGVAYSATFAASGGIAPYTWVGINNPSWLSLSSAGVLSGTPPSGTSSPVSFLVQVTDSVSATSTRPFTLPVNTAASLMFVTTSPLAPATAGVAYSSSFSMSGGVSPYTFSATGLPASLTLSSTGVLSGTPPSAGPVTFAVTANDFASNQVIGNFTLPVNAALTINTASPLPPATMGVAYSKTLTASGGGAGYTWAGQNLPSWLTLSSSGTLSGTPPAATAVSFTASVTDVANTAVSRVFTLPVNAVLTIGTTSPLPAATLNSAYSATFSASGGAGNYSWSASGLPAGFAVSSGGVLTGTPSSTTAIGFTVTVMDSASNTVNKPFTLPVNAALTINNTSPLPPATVGVPYTANFTASGGNGTYSWSSNNLPTWLTLTMAGYLSGTPPFAGPVSFQVSVSDSQSASASANFTLPVDAALTIGTTSHLPRATTGSAYSLQLAASGGSGSYTWTSSNLPSYLNLTAGGLITGTPPSSGSVTFSATVTDTLSNAVSRSFTLPVNAVFGITTSSPLPAATVMVPYSAQFTASGGVGPYFWHATSLPSWLTLTLGGYLSGTPPGAVMVTFSVTVTDSQDTADSGDFTLPVNSTLTIGNSSPLPTAVVGTAYSLQFTASGGSAPYTWTASALSSWLSLASGGLLTGTPPNATPATFSVTVTDLQNRTVTANFTLPVDPALGITTASMLPPATLGAAYTSQFSASGGSGSYNWSSSGLPSWLTISSSGVLVGIPPSAGSVNFPVTVQDLDGQTVTGSFTLPVNSPLGITTTSPLLSATVGAPYSLQFVASGGAPGYMWTAASLPTWLTVSSSGVLSGTPPSAGSVTFSVTVTDSQSQSMSKSVTLQSNATLTITTASPFPPATVGTAYTVQFAASGGFGAYTWTAASLPTWLTVSSSGVLSGTPPSAGSVTFSVTATDSISQSVTKSFTLQSNATLTITTVSPLPAATAGVAYTIQFAANGGTGAYTWAAATALPSWLTLSSSGTLSGTPPTAGPVTFAITAVDAAANRTSSTFTLPVNAMLTIGTPSPLAYGTVGVAYSQQFTASGGSGVYTWSGSNLPSWLNLNAAGVLSGTPPSAGSVAFTATVSDSLARTASGTFGLTINSALTINNATLLSAATVGTPYTLQFTASGGAGGYTWTAISLPPGFNLSSSGLLTGTPQSPGPVSFSVHVTDTQNSAADGNFTLPISAALAIGNTSPLPSATLGSVYSQQFRASGGSGNYSWTSIGLPHWLTLSATGFLTGIPPNPGSVTFTATVTDSQNNTATANFTVQVTSAVSIVTPPLLPAATVFNGYSVQLAARGGSGNYTWTASGLPAGLTLTPGGLLYGNPLFGGMATFTVMAADTTNPGNGSTQTFTLTIVGLSPPVITTTSPLSPATVGVPYSLQFAANGGSGAYSWTASGLPPSLTLSATGLLSGTPSNPGATTLNVTVADAQTGQSTTRAFTVMISTALTVTSTTPLPSVIVGQQYSFQLGAAGGVQPYRWTATGLPAGLALSISGLLSGQPSAPGSASFTVTVSDSSGGTAARTFLLTISASLTISTGSQLPAGLINTPYAATLSASGGTGIYTWSGSSLPSWLALSANGVLSGTPPIAGSFTVYATVTDTANAIVSKQFTLLVSSGLPLSLVAAAGPCAVGVPCRTSLSATGGTPPYTFALIGSASAGTVSVSPGGLVSAVFSAPGTATFTVQVTDGAQAVVSRLVSVQVVNPVMLTAPASATAPAGTAFTFTPIATQGAPPYVWSIVSGALPSGLTLSSVTGVISGTPMETGTFTFTLQVSDATGVIAQTVISLVISAPAISIQTAGVLPPGTAGVIYTQIFQAANTTGVVTWSLAGGSFPPGLTLLPNGALSGLPSQAGDFGFVVKVTDSSGASAQQSFQLHISGPSQPAPAISAEVSASVTAGDQPTVTITLSAPYPLPIVVTATLSLTPNPGDSSDLLFSNGSRTIQFTIPANTTQATLPFQAGTIAGTIQITFALQSAGTDITPSPAPTTVTLITPSAPVIRNVTASSTNGGFQLTVTGFSTTRDMKSAAFHFNAAPGITLQTPDATLDLGTFFAQWYQDPNSLLTGSQFSMTVPISVSGSVGTIVSVSVTMTNSVGASSSATVNLQ